MPALPVPTASMFATAAPKAAAPAPAAASTEGSAQGALTQALLALAQNPGTVEGGSAGYTVSNAPARAAATAAYNSGIANDANVYGQAVSNVNAQAPAIGSGYDTAIQQIQQNAANRQASDATTANSQNNNMAAEAARLGLSFVPTTDGTAASTAAALANQYKTNADAWNGLLTSQKQNALDANTRTANAFQYSGTQAQAALATVLQSALSKLADKSVGAKAGKIVGATTPSTAASIYAGLMGDTFKENPTPKTTTVTKTGTTAAGKTTASNTVTKSK